MANTTFPVTIDYVPGSQLMGTLRLTLDEAEAIERVFLDARREGAELTFQFDDVDGEMEYVDLAFEVAPESVSVVDVELFTVMWGWDLL